MVNPAFGPEHAFHHWGEPYLGYYVANDEWVIRKHAQMLTDAGVDVLFFDTQRSTVLFGCCGNDLRSIY